MPCEINIKCPRLLKFDRLKFDGSFLAPLLKLTKTAIGKTRELGEGASTLAVARASPCEVTVNVTARNVFTLHDPIRDTEHARARARAGGVEDGLPCVERHTKSS
jgi:hypothetical protein